MSRDIRSFFGPPAKKKATATVAESPANKRKAIQISSDEEEIPATPTEKHAKRKAKESRKKARIIESDDEQLQEKKEEPKRKTNLSKLKEPPKKDLKPINAASMFDGETKRVERKKLPTAEQLLLQSDEEFERSVLLDESLVEVNAVEEPKGKANRKKTPSPVKVKENQKTPNTEASKKRAGDKAEKNEPIAKKTPSPVKVKENLKTPNTEASKKRAGDKTEKNESISKTPKSHKKADLETSVLSDEERFERKRMSAILYQKYKNRQSGAINPGSKTIPKGKPNCLSGLTFLVTGVLESLERDEANQIIKDFGGKVSSTVGKRLNYLIVGEEAGPKKLATAEEIGVKIISEDDFLNLIREKSGEPVNNNNRSKSSPEATTVVKKEVKTEKKSPKKLKEERKSPKKIQEDIKQEKEDKVTHKVKTEVAVKKEVVEMEIDQKESFGEKPVTSSDPVSKAGLPWVEKYKPSSLKEIIGQQGPSSSCTKLLNWLKRWHTNHDGKKKLQKPNPWAKNDDGAYYKAALLSGPPGVGKTTTATLVCKELGFDTVEFNASDTRSKKLLKDEVSELLSNKSLFGYFHGSTQVVSKKHVLIMDEVDGMAGNEDRGGIAEMISLIKDSSVPIICICNDRNHQKIRSLVNYCYDLRFNKPRVEQIKSAIMSICFKEKFKLPPGKVEEIIAATNNDIRQTLNQLSLLSSGKDLKLKTTEGQGTARKDLKLGPWEVVRKVFSADEHKHMSINDKSDLFFNDYSLAPLFVQQNYLIVSPNVAKAQVPQQVALTADSLSLGDLIDKRIRSSSAWTLLPTQAMFSSVMPGEFMAGHFTGQINFPGWLGKNSKSTKRSRLAQEIHDHTRIRTSGSRLSVRMDYAPFLLDAIVRPLKIRGADGVADALNVMKEYRLLREDIDSLVELTTWPGRKNPMDSVDGKVKAALTRAYNKEIMPYTYSAVSGVKKKAAESAAEVEVFENEEEVGVQGDSDNEEDDKLENDALIKAKKPTAKTSSKSSSQKASTSKGKTTAGRSRK